MKIAICVPHYGGVNGAFFESVSNMIAATMAPTITYNGAITRPQITVLREEKGGLEFKRTRLALRAQSAGCDYALFCDTDHTFPPHALLRLLKHDKPIVGCNYLTTSDSPRPTAFDRSGAYLVTTEEKAKREVLEEVGAIGFGLCLIQTPIFDRIPRPWFASALTADGMMEVGEDVHFCNQARSAGIQIFVDHGLSWSLGHIGQRILFNSDYGELSNADSVLPAAGN